MITGLLSVNWLTMNIAARQNSETFIAWNIPCRGRFIVRSFMPLKCSITSRIEHAIANESSVYQMFAILEDTSKSHVLGSRTFWTAAENAVAGITCKRREARWRSTRILFNALGLFFDQRFIIGITRA